MNKPTEIRMPPEPVTIPIGGDGTDAGARAFVTIHGDFITEKEFNDAMDRYFDIIAKEMNDYIGGAILG